jgi:hypothetical protein
MQWDVDISKKRRDRPLEVERLMKDLLSRSDEDEPMGEDTELDAKDDGKLITQVNFSLLTCSVSPGSTPPGRPRNGNQRYLRGTSPRTSDADCLRRRLTTVSR